MALRARARAGPVRWSKRSIPSSDRLERLRPRVETDAGVAAARYSGAVEAWNCMRRWRIDESPAVRKGPARIFSYSCKSAGPAARPRRRRPPIASPRDVEDERELRAVLARVQLHRAAGAAEAPGPAGDRQCAVLRVEERALDRDLAAGEERRPVALVGRALDGAQAVAVVGAGLRGVGGVEDVVGEREDVADRVALGAGVGRRVGRGVLDDGDRAALAAIAAVAVAIAVAAGVGGDRDDQRNDGGERHDGAEKAPHGPSS